MAYSTHQKRHPAGAPKSIGGQYAPDNARGAASPAPASHTRTVQDVLSDEGYITVPNYNDGSEFDADYRQTELSRHNFQLHLDNTSTSIAVDANGLSAAQMRQLGFEMNPGDDYASLSIPEASSSIAEADELITSDARYDIATQLQDPKARAELVARVEAAPPYDPDAPSTHSEEHAMDGYVPEQVEVFLKSLEHFPKASTMGYLQNYYPEELDWWQSLDYERQQQILRDVAAEPEPEGEDRYQQYPEYRERIRQIAGEKKQAYQGATVYADPDSSYMGGSASVGSNYEQSRSMSNAEVSRAIRKHLKDAQQSGHLPKGAKISLRMYGGGYRVSVSGLPSEILHERMGRHDDDFSHYRGRRSGYANELADRIELIAGSYGHSSTNSQVDYFNSYRTATVQFES